ncbi:adenosylcobinamide kinase /adenosylcobinamide-phosphate guanylyltransferase [Cnuella takakiae]|uniref:Adenosylcobinamide kinase n=1 Tax=Cnuella takakiae TaxID=1302690 RepID=A0A1M5E3T1_9BACT|nr:bifunctional adenosylcobinamide kinase/adenosylcobinamide-phosphate guanylyltransferase [Cnuella takakiae]OLY93790.1 adenosylcobinamide kinase/adenosylcobinamide phosphate guanyltransferase [Cnuella takakiae]SHF73722.1 adenosylcobinamide kinase /adenosylcobinamide-phosphate guanylyltransferase [Cnuella takakiae]
MIHFITGGARSGKSRYAQELALGLSQNPVYLATAKQPQNDAEFSERIHRHQADRDERWTTLEEPLYPSQQALQGKVVVIDCVTLWLTNIGGRHRYNAAPTLSDLQKEVDALAALEGHFFIISNELGMGLHANTEIGRRFTDLQGWANQYIAAKADKVSFMVSGLPLHLK